MTSASSLANEQNPKNSLVGGWTNPSEKYISQIGHLPQIGMKMEKNIWVATT